MSGKVIEIDCDQPSRAMVVLRESSEFDDVSLYGAQIHVVTDEPDRTFRLIKHLLTGQEITVKNMAIIPPTLEDVFIANSREIEKPEGDMR